MSTRSILSVMRSRAAATGWTLAGALLVSAIAWYLGADVAHAVLIGAVVLTLGWAVAALQSAPDSGSDVWPDDDRRRPGSRDDIVSLALSLRGSRGRVGDVAVAHVRRLAERRLAARGLDLHRAEDHAAIEALIGRSATVALVRGRPASRSLARCLEALDALDAPDAPDAPDARSDTDTSRLEAHR